MAPIFYPEGFHGRRRALPGDRAFRQRHARPRRPAQDVLGAERQSKGHAGGLPSWRPGGRGGAGPSPLLRSGPLSHRHLRSARRRPLASRWARPSTTPRGHLVADIERLRRLVGVERWHVFGGSWGSTLALAYAEAHPERVLSLALRGIFLCRKEEIDWFLYGMRWLAPEIWREFVEYLPEAERGDLLKAYHTPPDRSRSRGPYAGGAQVERL